MILLILEGANTEPSIATTIRQLFFADNPDQLVCSYRTDTYTLWKEIKSYMDDGNEPDVFEIVRERLHRSGDTSLDSYDSYQFDSIYLFFDYDPQNRTVSMETLNASIAEMLKLFSDPMDKGQIFISYPMVESLFCQNSVPEASYMNARVAIVDCGKFKSLANRYECNQKRYKIIYKQDKDGNIREPVSMRQTELKKTWVTLVKMHAIKANYISNNIAMLPTTVEEVSELRIFNGQLNRFLPSGLVSLLSAFPMFLFEYFHGGEDF